MVIFQYEGTHVTARTIGPLHEHPAGRTDREHPYSHLVTPLRQRGLVCTVEFGLSDYIVHAELPDGSALIISPPQEPATDHVSGFPDSWLVTRGHPEDSTLHEVLYNSEPSGPHARYGGSVPRLLAAIDARLDQLGLPPRAAPLHLVQDNAADAVLHRAGFIPIVQPGEHYHRLPTAVTDPSEQRQAVTRAIGMLQADGFDVSCDPKLIDPSLPSRNEDETNLADRRTHHPQQVEGDREVHEGATEQHVTATPAVPSTAQQAAPTPAAPPGPRPASNLQSDTDTSPRHPQDRRAPLPDGQSSPDPSAAELSAITRGLTWQQRAALRVLARTPSRIRQRETGSLYVDTQTSSHIPITTWRALERKDLAHRDQGAHPASAIGQRLALTPLGLTVLNHLSSVTFPPSATQLWPPDPPQHFTTAPASHRR
jgi:hypothetical protein